MRGPLLGFGFAFGAAIMSSVVDGIISGWPSALPLFFWRFLLLLLPFVFPFVKQLPRQAHIADFVVPVYAVLLLKVPAFSGAWIVFDTHFPYGGLFPAIGPGNLVMITLLSTYFFGVRWWSEMVMDVKIRKGDVKNIALVVLAAITGAIIFGQGTLFSGQLSLPGIGIILGLFVAVPFEELLYRAFLQSGLKRLLSFVGNERGKKVVPMTIALLIAGIHALIGSYGLPPFATFGFSFGVGVMIIKRNRFLPALLGHAIALILIFATAAIMQW